MSETEDTDRFRLLLDALVEEENAAIANGTHDGLWGFVKWPEDQPKRYNGSHEPCDMWTGPCCCGGWHENGN